VVAARANLRSVAAVRVNLRSVVVVRANLRSAAVRANLPLAQARSAPRPCLETSEDHQASQVRATALTLGVLIDRGVARDPASPLVLHSLQSVTAPASGRAVAVRATAVLAIDR